MADHHDPSSDRSEIAFFDVETTFPIPHGQEYPLLEFGSILVCPRTLVEVRSYSTLIKPKSTSLISALKPRSNGITPDAVNDAASFDEIADTVYDILHGRIWAGHNIATFDCVRIKEAFEQIGRLPPEPKGIIDSLVLLTKKFGRRAGDMKMASLATFFGLGKQTHRSLDDVRMNLEVVKYCATVLFLESSLQESNEASSLVNKPVDQSGHEGFLDPDVVLVAEIKAFLNTLFGWAPRMELLHKNVPLKLCCSGLRVRFGIGSKFVDHNGRPPLNFVVDAPSSLCRVLDACDSIAYKLWAESGSTSEWRKVVKRTIGFYNYPTVRLRISPAVNGECAQYATEICQKDPFGTIKNLEFRNFDAAELEPLFFPGILVDAYLSVDPYDYQQNAGIRLAAKKLILYEDASQKAPQSS